MMANVPVLQESTLHLVLRLRGGLEAERVLVFLVERDLALAVAGDMPARGCGLCRRDLLILHVVAGVLPGGILGLLLGGGS